jgi:hypothetical protein
MSPPLRQHVLPCGQIRLDMSRHVGRTPAAGS